MEVNGNVYSPILLLVFNWITTNTAYGHIAFRCFFFKNTKIYIFCQICSTVCILQLK